MSIPVTHIDADTLIWLSHVIDTAIENDQYVRFSQQNGRIMIARGQGAWSPLMGEDHTV